MIKAFRQMFDRLIRRELTEAVEKSATVPVEAATRFTTDALMAVLTWWVEAKPRLSPVAGNRIFRQLIDPALKGNGFIAKSKTG